MARSRLDDLLFSNSFWLFDAGTLGGNLLFPVFNPELGFSAMTAPEINVEHKVIQPGNWQYKYRFVKNAEPGSITLSRGVSFHDSDMYNWITASILGKAPVRRSLFMLHFLGLRSENRVGQIAAGAAIGAIGGLASGGIGGAVTGAAGGAIVGGFIKNRIPGRAWVLHDCLPLRYKAGSDFDATSGAISIQELEVQPEHVVEVTIATLAPGVSQAVGVISGGVDVVNAAF